MASASGGFPPLTAFHRSWATCPSCGRLTTSGISGMRPAVVLAWRGSSKSVLFHGENSDLHHQCHTSRIEEISLFTTDTNFCSENVPAVRRSAPQPSTSSTVTPANHQLHASAIFRTSLSSPRPGGHLHQRRGPRCGTTRW